MESWEGGSELLILGMGSLSMLYLLLPIVLFGSHGWRQHLGSHAAGFALMMGIWGVLFSMESWAYHAEMLVLGLPFVLLLAITTTILWLVRRSQPGGASFYRNASLRLIPVLCLLAFYVL